MLTLVSGPANAGKVAMLLERYLARVDEEPFLIVPNRSDVGRCERDLLARAGCLLGGTIGTFDDLFERIAAGAPDRRRVATRAQRALLARRAVAAALRDGVALPASARYSGFADSLVSALSDLEGGLLEPSDLDGELRALYAAYRAELDALGLWDRDLMRRSASERLQSDLSAWGGEPVFAYGFEDLTAAEWSLLEALAGRADVHVSLPYEPGRAAFASLARTANDLAALARGSIEELPPRAHEYAAPALAHLERSLFESGAPAPVGGAVRFLAGAGARGTLELVADELLDVLRDGTPAEQVALIVPSVERWRAPLETVMAGLGIPYVLEASSRFSDTPLGHALLSLLRFAWGGGGRGELYTFLRSPYSAVPRTGVDFTEGRLRGRAVEEPARVEEETERLREAPLVALRELREAPTPLDGVRTVLPAMVRAAYGLEAPPAGEAARLDLRSFGIAGDLLDELAALEIIEGTPLSTPDVLDALARLEVPPPPAGEAGRVAVLDLLRARTRRFDTVFVLGLEEGTLPRRGRSSPFLDDDRRRELGSRLERPDPVARDRYLFYTACTRPTRRLYLVRQAATDDGGPLEPSPFWEDAASVFAPEDVERATRRRALSELTWPIEGAPTERERLRSLARLSAGGGENGELAAALADSNGWSRRLQRARRAFVRDPRLRNRAVLDQLGGRTTFGATELERFVDCSSAWLFERVVDPKTIDAEADALLRGKIAHQALYAFYSGLPKELGVDRVTPDTLEAAIEFLERCLASALGSGVRLELREVEAAELRESLRRDLVRFIRSEAESKLTFLPRRFELGFGTDRSAPELQRGLELGDGLFLSGKIDRIDIDPMSARGIVQDYKSGKGSFSARQIDTERRLQVPLYMLVLRDLAGIEPLGGVYRALSGARAARGMLRAETREELPGFHSRDYLDEEGFWGQVDAARDRARDAAQRIRAGDVAHDPKGGECPNWCDLWTMCRVSRA